MIRSMTGYGAAAVKHENGSVRVEIRSLNSRHLKLSLRGPDPLVAWEPGLRERVSREVHRGRVELALSAETEGGEVGWELDTERVKAYLEAFDVLRHEYDLPGQPDLMLLLHGGGVLRERASARLDWLTLEMAEEAIGRALRELIEMREREGSRLADDLRGRVTAIRSGLEEAERLAPDRLARERERLRTSVAELTEGSELDADRIAREIALIADRWDVGEELVRARAHLEAFEEYLDAPADEPVGKRLGFLVQELHREVNTLGAKANDARISRLVVEMKNEIEKLREQVENVE